MLVVGSAQPSSAAAHTRWSCGVWQTGTNYLLHPRHYVVIMFWSDALGCMLMLLLLLFQVRTCGESGDTFKRVLVESEKWEMARPPNEVTTALTLPWLVLAA